jgi:hypothetical protein
MAQPSLDQIVKGAPPPNINIDQVISPASHDANDRLSALKTPRPPQAPSDPTSLLPSSPPQIYLNLLILEASLRAQYLTLRARRRQNTFVLTGLAVWTLFFSYLLWLRPRDDGKGVGGSQYWLVDMGQKVCFITGVVTVILFWATGQWERGVRWPRRWIGVANRGLRGMNCKIVVIRGPWWKEIVAWLHFLMPFSGGLWGGTGEEVGSYHFVNVAQERREGLVGDPSRARNRFIREDGKEFAEEDVAPGGDYIKLLLLPKPFTPDFRENWELYRTEYWERENERRAELRRRIKARQREIAREEGGWLWWTGWRGWKKARVVTGGKLRTADLEKIGSHGHAHSGSVSSVLTKDRKRRPSLLPKDRGRDPSHSRSSSRSTTPTPDLDVLDPRERRWSSTSTTAAVPADRRRKKTSTSTMAPPSRTSNRFSTSSTGSGSRPVTPLSGTAESGSWQSKRRAERLEERDFGSDGAGRQGNVFPNAPSA